MGADAIRVLLYAVLSRSTLAALSLIAAWFLNEQDFGVFSYIVLTTASVATLSAVGVSVTCNTTAARYSKSEPGLVAATLTASLAMSWLLAVIVASIWALATPPRVSEVFGIGPTAGAIFILALIMASTTAFEGASYGLRSYTSMIFAAAAASAFAVVAAGLGAFYFGLLGAVTALVASRFAFLLMLAHGALVRLRHRIGLSVLQAKKGEVIRIYRNVGVPIALAAVLSSPIIAAAVNVMTRDAGLAEVGAFNLMYQLFLICTFPASSISHYLLSRYSDAETGTVGIMASSMAFAGLLGAVGLAVLYNTPLVLSLLAFDVRPEPVLGLWFGIGAALYCIHLMFISYWPSIDEGRFVLGAQLLWAASMIYAVLIGGDAVFFAKAFALGCLLQVVFHVITYLRVGPRVAAG